jgi:hypothetical protein
MSTGFGFTQDSHRAAMSRQETKRNSSRVRLIEGIYPKSDKSFGNLSQAAENPGMQYGSSRKRPNQNSGVALKAS